MKDEKPFQTCNMNEDTDLYSHFMQTKDLLNQIPTFAGMRIIPSPYLSDYEVVVMVGEKYYKLLKEKSHD